MAMIYDFPTNYEEKIDQATKLMEKDYIDQAICLLEDSDSLLNVSSFNFTNKLKSSSVSLNCPSLATNLPLASY